MQYWDEVLYPSFRATIRGAYYGVVTPDMIDEECYFLAQRAVFAFKFPKISTKYETFYAVNDEGVISEVKKDAPGAVPHGRFLEQLGYAELEIIIAWMKVYWCENQISNADNFEDVYTDANIKTYSRANALDKNLKLLDTYRKNAKELEERYYRTTVDQKPAMGGINADEQ